MTMKQYIDETNRMLDFIRQSPSSFHVVRNAMQRLRACGFEELCLKKRWELEPGGKYFTHRNGSSLIAFTLGDNLADTGFRIIASHSDTPTFRIKPLPESVTDNSLVKFNIEPYGGALLYSWLDRPLSAAGRVVVSTGDALHPQSVLVDLRKPLGVIPSVAIHLDRQANDSLSLNKQDDMQLLVQAVGREVASVTQLRRIIASEADLELKSILDFDLYLYDTERGCIVGSDQTMVLSPKLDNLEMVYASIEALCDTAQKPTSKMICIFDNEEVGSATKQGACSPLLPNIIARIAGHLGLSREDEQRIVYNSFLVSADMAHGVHPNRPQKHDPLLHPTLNGGIVIKVNAAQKYMTDAVGSGVFRQLCTEAGVPYQLFANRNDVGSGSTLGNKLTQQLDITGVDVGTAILGMHSSRETGGVKDTLYARQVFKHFLSK